MRNNKKRGFTLVELLVVIAILAILATVSVVGYTSFIERAYVSNDQNVVTQLNNYLDAYMADHSSRYYGEDITENNYMFIADEIFESSGIGKYNAQAEEFGYYMVLNYETDQFELVHENESHKQGAYKALIAWAAGEGADFSRRPGTNFVKDGKKYGFLHTTTGELAEVLETFHTAKKMTTEEYIAHLENMLKLAKKLDDGDFNYLADWMTNTIFVTINGNFTYSEGKFIELTGELGGSKTIVIHKNATEVSLDNFIGTLKENANIVVPEDTKVTSLGSDIKNQESTANVNFNVKNPTDIGGFVDAGIVSDTVSITFGSDTTEHVLHGVEGEAEQDLHIVNKTQYEEYKAEMEEYNNSTDPDAVKPESPAEVVELKYNNPIKDFDLDMNHEFASDKYFDEYTVSYIAWEQLKNTGYKALLASINAVGQTAGGVSKNEYRWYIDTVDGEAYNATTHKITIDTNTGEITFGSDYDLDTEVITVKATAVLTTNGEKVEFDTNGKPKTTDNIVTKSLNIRVASIRKVDFSLAGHGDADGFWTYDEATSTYKVTLVHKDAAGTSYNLINKITFNNNDSTLNGLTKTITFEADKTGSISYTNNGENSTVTTIASGVTTLTVKIADFKTYKIEVTVVDLIGDLAIQAKNPSLKYVGNGNAILLSDIFTGNLPANAELRVFNYVPENDADFMNPASTRSLLTTDSTKAIYVDSNKKFITTLDTAVQFGGTRTDDVVTLALFSNGVRISPDVEVHVVNGTNVRTYAEMVAKMNSGSTGVSDGYPLTDNIVFLSDITMDSTNNYFTIPSGTTVYGNTFDFDIKNGRLEEEGIINLKGTIRDVKIIGKTYPTFASSAGDEYGSSAINATGTAYIYNCYISNTRSPLRTSGTTTIEDTVLFGGRYSNIDMTGGSITIKGVVTTVQQLHSADGASNVIGVGVTGWFNDSKKTVNISEGANFVQYNFMDSNIKDYLPKVEIMGTEVIDLKLPFNTIFTDSDYTAYRYTATNGGVYANSGMIATDAYMLNYTVTGGDMSGRWVSDWFDSGYYYYYPVGYEKTVTLQTSVADDEKFIVVHDSRFTPQAGTVKSSSSVELTGAQLKAGVVFALNTEINFGRLVTEDGTNYWFQIQSDNYRTINVSGSGDYNHLTYKYDTDMSGKMYLADEALSLAGKTLLGPRGLHYGRMEVDVYTPMSTAKAVGNYTYQQLLEQYIEMGTYYTPEVFEFNSNGTITNYWQTK